jgi:hypothetical protein
MTNSLPWYRWPIEIDGLPIKNGDFPWRTVSHNQRVRDILGYDNKRQSWTFNKIYIYNGNMGIS